MTDTHAVPADSDDAVWLFGYGSLIYRADFPWLTRERATLHGWIRRFWQGSHDHRGTPEAPGRVVTLLRAPGTACVGVAYRIAPTTFEQLDRREQNGYVRVPERFVLDDGRCVDGVVYVADAGNIAYLGTASEAEIARHIASARGPSGSNSDYLLQLATALRALGEHDAHVFDIERQLLAMTQ